MKLMFTDNSPGGHACRNMRKIITFVFVLFVAWGCTSDKEIVDNFGSCLNEHEKLSYSNLVSFCDQFISSNYPNDPLEDGYRKFLSEVVESDPKAWKTDKAKILEMSSELKRVFGDSYDQSRASFTVKSPIAKCLQASNNERFFLARRGIKNLLEDKEKKGELGPNILAGAMLTNKIDPTKGLNKVIFVTEVLWRLVYLNSMEA